MSDAPARPGGLTRLLQRWHAGDAASLDQLLSDIYPDTGPTRPGRATHTFV